MYMCIWICVYECNIPVSLFVLLYSFPLLSVEIKKEGGERGREETERDREREKEMEGRDNHTKRRERGERRDRERYIY